MTMGITMKITLDPSMPPPTKLTRVVIEQAADGPAHLALLVAGGSRWFRFGAIVRHRQRSARSPRRSSTYAERGL